MPTVDQLRSSLAQARSSYGGQFAGQPRATRKPERLQSLIDEVNQIAVDAGGQDAELASDAANQVERWKVELAAIRDLQAQGPGALQSALLVQWGRDNTERYRRNFAGQSRATRDLGLLLEIVDQVDSRIRDMDALQRSRPQDTDLKSERERLGSALERYRNELLQLRAVRLTGTREDRVGLLARLANGQFNRYRLHFANKSRISRRPALLNTIIQVLEEIQGEMITLRDTGSPLPQNQQNIEIVGRHLTTYRTERDALKRTHDGAVRSDRVSALAQAANQVMADYRSEFLGHPRSTRDPARLNELWELLWPIALDTEEQAKKDDSAPVAGNMQAIHDALRLYEREWRLVSEAQPSA